MNTYIALLRGINVSGQKKILMAELRELLTKLGLMNVRTYIQSGNVIFESNQKDTQKLELSIHESINKHYGFEVPILVLTSKDLQLIFNACPLDEKQKTESYFMLLYAVPDEKLVEEISKMSYEKERFFIINKCIYFHSSIGYGNSKFNNNFFERKLKVTATARNYKTMVKLLSLSAQ